MGIVLTVIFLVFIFLIYINRNREESTAIRNKTQKLPEGAHIFFDKKVSGHSRKGVVTYYSHFVQAFYKSSDGQIQNKTFPFDDWNLAEKATAWDCAHRWVIEAHETNTSGVQRLDQVEAKFAPGITTLDQLINRLGTPQSVRNEPDGQVAAVWTRSKVAMTDSDAKKVTILFDKDRKMIRIVRG